MNPAYYDMIFKRKSFHLFRGLGEARLSAEELREIEEASNWECGIAIPNVYQARALCLALDMDLIGIENEKQNEESFLLPLNAKGVQKVKEYASDLIASGNYTKASLPKHI